MKLGVFDSGIGGEAVAAALRVSFPDAQVITVNDRLHVPYGDRSSSEVILLTNAAIQPLLREQCDVIILACNTATALAIQTLRSAYPQQQFIGIEPMIKTAAARTKSGIVAVCATPATLASERYDQLLADYGAGIRILEPNCRDWARMIENNLLEHQLIRQTVTTMCDQGADVIVLGCTHYHWIKDLIVETAGDRAVVIEPSDAIGRRVQQLLSGEPVH
ncbi:MAG: aspartate/glutamate racemase family protein [Candidatus Saccharimonadales bacterium]